MIINIKYQIKKASNQNLKRFRIFVFCIYKFPQSHYPIGPIHGMIETLKTRVSTIKVARAMNPKNRENAY